MAIVAQLIGGLGNQLFQYAAARALAERTNGLVKLDAGPLRDHTNQRPYRLDAFEIRASLARKSDVPFAFRAPYRSPLTNKLLSRLPKQIPWSVPGTPPLFQESSFAYDQRIAYLTNHVYLVGFWQSYRYFESIAPLIRDELALSARRAGVEGSPLTRETAQEGTVSVHVRRGDYINHPVMSNLTVAHYERALELLMAHTRLTRAYVFSDDIPWTRQHLKLPLPMVFAENTLVESDLADFFLMSACHHHLIANSSFSWWAAWLAPREGFVVAPSRWFNDESVDTSDLRPPEWLVV